MKKEQHYDFRKRLAQVHIPRRSPEALPQREDEIAIDGSWKIVPLSAEKVLIRAAADLQDYFRKSFDLDLPIAETGAETECCITISVAPEDHERRSRISAEENVVRITGATAREAAQGCYRLEDELNLRGEVFVKKGSRTFTRLFSPRMTHSGWELEIFPDEYLPQIAHAGMDAIIIFIREVPDITRNGKIDLNAVVEKAAEYGLDVYVYPHVHTQAAGCHPLDDNAEEFYDDLYGAIVKNAPGIRGLVFVGESVGFPSREEGVSGYWWDRSNCGKKAINGFWPVADWSDWLVRVRDVTRKYKSDLELYFWTYNWFWAPAEDRLRLLEHIPTDITLHVTFEMGDESVEKCGVPTWVEDYSITSAGPGTVFTSEAEVAARRGIKLTSMTNTAGSTWDFGVVPYMPFPFAWMKRYENMLKARQDWGLSGTMESHHYGFTPSFISELAKTAFTEELTVDEDHLLAVAARDFGRKNAAQVVAAWRDWSDAMYYHSARGFDQYGSLRVGPVFPFTFPGVPLPDPLHPQYQYHNGIKHGTGWMYMAESFKMPAELIKAHIEMAEKELALFISGNEKLRSVLDSVPEHCKETAQRMMLLGDFLAHCVRTMRNVKQFYQRGLTVQDENSTKDEKRKALSFMRAILADEERNVRETIPLVDADSRLGWEATMLYTTDRENLEWKLDQLKDALKEVQKQETLYL